MGDAVMKNFAILMFMAWAAATVVAQPPPHARGPSTLFRDKPEPSSPARQWMLELSENDPAEYERLQRLRRENPRAFRETMREQLENSAMERLEKNRPAVYAALIQLSPEDRSWVLERMAGHGRHPPENGRDHNRLKTGSRELIRDYRDAENDSERAAIRARLSEELGRLYDRRLEERRDQLENIQARIRDMEAAVAEGEQNREAFIQERLSMWLDVER